MDKNTCNICRIRAYIQCDQCDQPIYFCSRGHLYSHKMKIHKSITRNNSITNMPNFNKSPLASQSLREDSQPQVDMRKLFEYIHTMKTEIDNKMSQDNYMEVVLLINKCLPVSKKFYQEDHIFNVELIYKLAESYIQIANLEEAVNTLETLLNVTQNSRTNSISSIRFKTHMLIGATCINMGDYVKALKVYNICEQEVLGCFTEPEVNLKIASLFLNIGICYVYMGNINMAEKYFKKGMSQTDGMLGNEIIYKLHSDLNENLGVVNEQIGKPKEAINFYKKSLKTKFGLYGENNDEVLDLQYKISSIYITNKQYKEAEEIMTAMTDVVLKEKLNSNNPKSFTHQYYRYGVYFYTTGTVLLKNNKINLAKEYLNKASFLWKDLLDPNDPVLNSLNSLIKICNKKY